MSKFKNYPSNKRNIRRNLDLWNDRKHGFTYKQLSDKYRVSCVRCRQIYLKIERIRERRIYGYDYDKPILKQYFGEDWR